MRDLYMCDLCRVKQAAIMPSSSLIPITQNKIYTFLANIYGGVIGFGGGVCLFNMLPVVLFHYKESIKNYQKCFALLTVPWTFVALIGAISDTYPLFKWHKRYYLMAAITLLATMLVITSFTTTLVLYMTCLVVISFSIVSVMTLGDSHVAVLRSYFRFHWSVMPFVEGFQIGGSIPAAIIVGLFAGSNGDNSMYAFLVAVPFVLLPLKHLFTDAHDVLPGDFYTDSNQVDIHTSNERLIRSNSSSSKASWYETKKQKQERVEGIEWRMVVMMAMSGVMVMIPLIFMRSMAMYLGMALMSGVMVVWMLMHTYPKDYLYKCVCIYSMLHEIFACTNIRAAIDAFYTFFDTATCITGGPQLPILFYASTVSVFTGVGGVIAAMIAPYLLRRYTARSIIIGSTIVGMLSGLSDISIAMGYNRQIGLGDRVVFVFGVAVVQPAAHLVAMITMDILATSCIDRAIATRFSVYSSFRYIGMLQSYVLGLVFTQGMGLEADIDVGCNFATFPRFVLVTNMCMPVIAIALGHVFIPNYVVQNKADNIFE